jgi:hypothetical protein
LKNAFLTTEYHSDKEKNAFSTVLQIEERFPVVEKSVLGK